MTVIVESAKVMSKGQITLPRDIRDKLNVGTGDRVVLIWDGGRVVMMNAGIYAMQTLQQGFIGAAEEAGIDSEDDVNALISEARQGEPGR